MPCQIESRLGFSLLCRHVHYSSTDNWGGVMISPSLEGSLIILINEENPEVLWFQSVYWVCPQRLLMTKDIFENHLGLVGNKRLLQEGVQKVEKIGR